MDSTFTETWRRTVDRHGTREFLLFRDDDAMLLTWTYAEFDDVVARAAATLHALGVGPGDAVHLVLRNCPAFVAAWLAAARLGAWMVPVDPVSSAHRCRFGRLVRSRTASWCPVSTIHPDQPPGGA